MCRLSHEGRGDISSIARRTISYFVIYVRLYLGRKLDYIFKLLRVYSGSQTSESSQEFFKTYEKIKQ